MALWAFVPSRGNLRKPSSNSQDSYTSRHAEIAMAGAQVSDCPSDHPCISSSRLWIFNCRSTTLQRRYASVLQEVLPQGWLCPALHLVSHYHTCLRDTRQRRWCRPPAHPMRSKAVAAVPIVSVVVPFSGYLRGSYIYSRLNQEKELQWRLITGRFFHASHRAEASPSCAQAAQSVLKLQVSFIPR